MISRFTAILFFSIITSFCSAQVSIRDLVFESIKYEMGTVYSDQTDLTATFPFVNGSKKPLVISEVSASCGCTNPRADKDTVLPGESANIYAQFNPEGFYGRTTKQVYLRGNFSDGYQVELEFTADVKTSSARASEDQSYYKGQYGYLVLEKNAVYWGNQLKGNVYRDTIRFLNDGYYDITISKTDKSLPYLKFVNLPLTIKPNTKGYLLVDLDLNNIDTVGSVYGMVKLITDDKFVPNKEINYNFNVVIDYTQLSRRDVRRSPIIMLDTNEIDMGSMKSGTVRTKKITISNTGKKALKLQRIESDCTCTLVDPKKRVLEPGESLEVLVKYDSLNKKGSQIKRVKIYSNDPINPLTTILVYATVD